CGWRRPSAGSNAAVNRWTRSAGGSATRTRPSFAACSAASPASRPGSTGASSRCRRPAAEPGRASAPRGARQCLAADGRGRRRGPASETGAGLAQEFQLLGRGLAAEDGIAVRVAAEAVDDGLVPALEVEVLGAGEPLEQPFGLGMDPWRLAVHVGHQQEAGLY